MPGSGLKLPLDLHAIGARCSNAYFAPKRFAAVQLAFSNPRCRVLVFRKHCYTRTHHLASSIPYMISTRPKGLVHGATFAFGNAVVHALIGKFGRQVNAHPDFSGTIACCKVPCQFIFVKRPDIEVLVIPAHSDVYVRVANRIRAVRGLTGIVVSSLVLQR